MSMSMSSHRFAPVLAAVALSLGAGCKSKPASPSAPSDLAYQSNPAVYNVGTAIPPNSASFRGGPVQQFTVTPDLPAGLVLNSVTGTVSGTPSAITPLAIYTVVASSALGVASAELAITVNDAPPAGLAYATNPATYVGGAAITANVPTCGGGTVRDYRIQPALPAGLSLDPSSGVLSGTPMALADGTWTVTASNAGGSTSAALALRVTAPPPPAVTSQPAAASIFRGETATFGVAASGVALSYQWRADGVAVPGATAASYTTPRQDVSADGSKYDVVIHDPFGGVTTSAPATLTVKPGGFWSTGDMLASRTSHTATALANGKILIAGGYGTASAELFDPDAGVFTTTGSMTAARAGHAATLLGDGKVLITGGETSPHHSTNAAEIYDPATGAFTATDPMATARTGHTAIRLLDGTVLVAGGSHLGTTAPPIDDGTAAAEIFDPATGRFTATATPMSGRRAGHAAALLADGKVLLSGGFDWKSGDLTGTTFPLTYAFDRTIDLYDPATRSFSVVGTGFQRVGHTATPVAAKVLLAGGFPGAVPSAEVTTTTAAAELYDPALATSVATQPMRTARSEHTATLLPSGKVLMVGGIRVSAVMGGTLTEELASTELFDPVTGAFSPGGAMMRARSGHTATLLPDGSVLVTGGTGSAGTSAEIYR